MGNVRVRGHDYRSKGYYVITFGTLDRRPWLSRIVDGRIRLEPAGELLMQAWLRIAEEDPAYELGVTAVVKFPRARIIKLEPWGLKRYKPSGNTATRWLASGRALVLSGFPDDEPQECRRRNCL